jgi:hypothetical protein
LTGNAFTSGSGVGTISLVDTEGLFTRRRQAPRLHTQKFDAIGFRTNLSKLIISGRFWPIGFKSFIAVPEMTA